MPIKKYGVLKGTIIGHLRDADDDHYQILVQAGDTLHRIAVNVKSSAPNAPSTLLFLARNKLPDDYVDDLAAVEEGFTELASQAGGLAIDYVRSKWFKHSSMVAVPPDLPGNDNDLKDKLEAAVLKGIGLAGSAVYAFGSKWGPEKNKPDQYFQFSPGSGIHNIHMNQGNSGKYKGDNGIFQDGALIFAYPDGRIAAFFLAFPSQTPDTDDSTGNPVDESSTAKLMGKPGYPQLKVAVLKVLGECAHLDILSDYGPGGEYSAKTKLDTIGLTTPVRNVIPKNVNRALESLFGSAWRDVGPADLVKCSDIGDVIKLACLHAGVPLPSGEPK